MLADGIAGCSCIAGAARAARGLATTSLALPFAGLGRAATLGLAGMGIAMPGIMP